MRLAGWMVAASGVAALIGVGAASACGLTGGGGGERVTIAADAQAGNREYALLYSTLGYERAATKRLLIRQNDPAAAVSEGLAFAWRLVDAKGAVAASGRAGYAGTAWGIPLWAADFSKVTKSGSYRVVVESPGVVLATEAFPIDEYVLFKTTYSRIALDNAEARQAPIEKDYGYFDGNEESGTVTAHADFLVGLLESLDRRKNALNEDERRRTRDAIDRALDYLLLLSDPGTGETAGQSATRPFRQEGGASATAAAARALAHFAALSQADDPERADRAYRRAKLAEKWVDTNAPEALSPALRAAVDYDLYRFSGDRAALDRAAKDVRDEVGAYDLRTMDRRSSDGLPHFEAMFRMWRDLPDHPDRALWEDAAKRVAAQYKSMIDRSVFDVIPPGVTDAERGPSAQDQWDGVETLQLAGDGPDAVVGNDWFMARAIDASLLAQIAGDPALEAAASASLEWVEGLNPGVPAERIAGASGNSARGSASFVIGLGVRSVQPWSLWEWPRSKQFASIVGGFRAGFAFEDGAAAANTSIRRDGLWLYATAAYEDYLNRGKNAPAPDAPAVSAKGVSVASAIGSEADGLLRVLVTVVSPDGSALADAKVTVAWSGVASPEVRPDDRVRTTQCLTVAGGSCLVTLAEDALPVRRPISAVVTNVEHPLYAYDPTQPAAPVVFP